MKRFEIELAPYGRLLTIYYGKAKEMAKVYKDHDIEPSNLDRAGTTIYDGFPDDYDLVIYINNETDYQTQLETTIHEFMHAALDVFEEAGVSIISEDAEPVTYFIDYYLTKLIMLLKLGKET